MNSAACWKGDRDTRTDVRSTSLREVEHGLQTLAVPASDDLKVVQHSARSTGMPGATWLPPANR